MSKAAKERTQADRLRAERRTSTALRIHLRDLTNVVTRALAAIDAEMMQLPTADTGKRMAQICNAMQLQNDIAKRFGLARGGPK